jgi:16S rRNA (cytosine1402-N4)-methyltransferase
MPKEVAYYLDCRPGGVYVDGTIGGSGHAADICKKMLPNGFLIGIDRDETAVKKARNRLSHYKDHIRIFHDNFIHLSTILSQLEIKAVNGILLDLGISLHQIEASGRGFSFRKDEPLDMRMNHNDPTTAADLVNRLDWKALADIFYNYGDEYGAGRIAKEIVRRRREAPIETSLQLSKMICSIKKKTSSGREKRHPATKIFMALRIAVNKELENLRLFLDNAVGFLKTGGRFCVLSFHSLEDRMVKQRFKAWEKGCVCPPGLPVCACGQTKKVRILTPKARKPTKEEIQRNPMARSTRLRAVEKL